MPAFRRLSILFVLLHLSVSGCAKTGSFEDGQAAENKGDYATALRLWRPLAEQGHATAQNSLGVLYAGGQGVPKDAAAAVKWFRLAAEQGYAGGQNNLGMMYANGQGVPQDSAEADKWFRLAAEQGLAEAQYNLKVLMKE
jgi:hypothetical protein